MNQATKGFWLPKAGNSHADYEDAFAVASLRVAIADGATESSFARVWAEALVEGFAGEPGADADGEPSVERHAEAWWTVQELQEVVASLQKAWHDKVPWDRLPWFAEDKARSGAFATLLAFEFVKGRPDTVSHEDFDRDGAEPEPRWQALAIGDSCLFQIRDDAIRVAFPLEFACQFSSRPILLSSNAANNERAWETVAFCSGECREGDVFLFATDALAWWILAEAEAGGRPWQTLCRLQSQAEFTALITRLRERHSIRNDDMTLVRIHAPTAAPRNTQIAPEAGLGPREAADEVSSEEAGT